MDNRYGFLLYICINNPFSELIAVHLDGFCFRAPPYTLNKPKVKKLFAHHFFEEPDVHLLVSVVMRVIFHLGHLGTAWRSLEENACRPCPFRPRLAKTIVGNEDLIALQTKLHDIAIVGALFVISLWLYHRLWP